MKLRVVFPFATYAPNDQIERGIVEAHALWCGGRCEPVDAADRALLVDHQEAIARRWRENRRADRLPLFGPGARKWLA